MWVEGIESVDIDSKGRETEFRAIRLRLLCDAGQ